MDPLALFGISVVFSFAAWGVVTARYVWPKLRILPQQDALRPLLTLHAFRFIGLAFLVPGVVAPELPAAFARPAAYGDVIANILALLALAVLRTSWGTAAVWLFNLCGTADLLYAFYQGPLRSRSAARLPGCSLLYPHGARTAAVHHARNNFQATHAVSSPTKSARVTCLPPHKRLKVTGGDRSKGNGVLCAGAHQLTLNSSCASVRVARSLSAIR